MRFLCNYAGVSEEFLTPEAQVKLDNKVVMLAKAGGGYILKNSLVLRVLDHSEEILVEALKLGALAVVTKKAIPGCQTKYR